MTAFEFLSVALSFVLGLAVTLVLTSLLAAFRARRETELDWLPFTWAAYVLVYQFQYWWAIFELSSFPEWTVISFGLLLLLAIILFLAGGLVLPQGFTKYPDDLGRYFREDGKWGVVALAAYLAVGTAANVVLFESAMFSTLHVLQAAGLASAALVVINVRRSVQWSATALFGVLLIWSLVLATPWAY